MVKELPLDEQILKQKKSIRGKKVLNIILIVLLSLVTIFFAISTINYVCTTPKFEDKNEITIIYENSKDKDGVVIYNEQQYTYDDFIRYLTAEDFYTSGKVFFVLLSPILLIGIIITSVRIKNKKDVLNNLLQKQLHANEILQHEEDLKFQKIQYEINTLKQKYCEYCGSKIVNDYCNNCGAKIQKR